MKATGLIPVIVFAALALAACASPARDDSGAPLVRQITQSPNCGLTEPGAVFVSSPDALDRLVGIKGQNLTTAAVRKVSLDQEHLVFVTLGEKPTAGFTVGLDNARANGTTLMLNMAVGKPAPGTMVAQVITTPCAILALPAGDWRRIEVTGLSERPLVTNLHN